MAELRIRYFAAAAEASGVEEETIDTAAATAGELKAELVARHGPAMARVLRSGSLLIDGVARRDDATPLGATPRGATPPGATVDVLPPFSGG